MDLTGSVNGLVLAAGWAETVIWCASVLAAVFILGAALMVIRHKYRPQEGRGEESAGFGIEQLESMVDDGQISRDEFRALRRAALGLDCGAGSDDNAPSSGGSDDDDECKGDG